MKTEEYNYDRWDKHLKSLVNWLRYEEMVNNIIEMSSLNSLILEVGCGFGQITEMLYLKGRRIFGVDLGKNKVWRHLRGSFIRSDGCHLPFMDETFDMAFFVGVIEHVSEDSPCCDELLFLKELNRVLKWKGCLLCHYIPTKYSLEAILSKIGYHTHSAFYDYKSIRELLKASGFELIRIETEHLIPDSSIRSLSSLFNRLALGLYKLEKAILKLYPILPIANSYKVIARCDRP